MRAAVALVLAASFLAGCTAETAPLQGAPADVPGALATQEGRSPGGPLNATAAGLSLGTAWVQEYWGGDLQKTLLEASGTVMNYATTSVINCPLQCTDVFWPLETLVAPGTERVEVTLQFTRPATAPGMVMDLAWRTAAEDSIQVVAAEPDTPVVIQVAAADWDAPLQARSLWWFDVFPSSSGFDHISDMEVAITVVAHRAAALPEYPPPPDPWAQGNSITLHAANARANQALRTAETNSCFNCEGLFWESTGSGLVPEGAGTLTATLAWDWPGPTKPLLGYWSGPNPEGTLLELAEDGGTARTFTLAVPPGEVDSPYQPRSSWGFFMIPETSGQVNQGLLLGTATLDVVVTRG